MDEKPELPEFITIDSVKNYVKYIESIQNDDERAHSMTDRLHIAVLNSIVNEKCEDYKICAKEALKTEDLPFDRWCA